MLGERNQRRMCSYTRALEPWEEWAHAEMRFRKEILTLEKERKEKHEWQQEGQWVWEAWCFHLPEMPGAGRAVRAAGGKGKRGGVQGQNKLAGQVCSADRREPVQLPKQERATCLGKRELLGTLQCEEGERA